MEDTCGTRTLLAVLIRYALYRSAAMTKVRPPGIAMVAQIVGLCGVVILCVACTQEPGDEREATRKAPDEAVEQSDEFLLAPYIPESGTAVLFYREAWGHVEDLEMGNPPGVPFDAKSIKPYSLRLGIWTDGTIIWSQGHPRELKHYEGKVSTDAIGQLLDRIDPSQYRSAESLRFTEDALYDSHIPGAAIVVLAPPKEFVLASFLDSMELVEEYWFWSEGNLREYPFTKSTFDQFCSQVPAAYAQHLRKYASLRARLQSIVPSEGKQLDLDARIRWILLPMPKPRNMDSGPRAKSSSTERSMSRAASLAGPQSDSRDLAIKDVGTDKTIRSNWGTRQHSLPAKSPHPCGERLPCGADRGGVVESTGD